MEKKEWKKNILMAVIIVIGVIGYIAGFNEKTVKTSVQSGIAEEILRFHVIANSDSKEDQELKMKVKEEIVSYVSLLTEGEEDVHKAEYIIIGNCSDCSNTVMGSAPQMKLKVFHQTDHVMRTIGHSLYRKLRVSKSVDQLPNGK